MDKNILWQPQKKQVEFMKRCEDEVLYGGAAGGGKSDALIMEALRQVDIPNYEGIIFRKTYPQCAELISKSLYYYKKAYPNAKYNHSAHVWTFPSGAKISFGNMHHIKDRINYQGRAFDFIAFDELTHFTFDEYSYMRSRNRPKGPGTRCYIRGATNPGGIGHAWVKKMFIEGRKPFKTYEKKIDIDGHVFTRTSAFIPATVYDNQALLTNDIAYLARLGDMPEAEKKALLYGDWDTFSGQVFIEFRNNPDGYETRKYTHVIKPFEIPKHWKRYRTFDWGYTKPFSVGWWAIDTEGRVYRYREMYGCKKDVPNTGIRWGADIIAKKIREIENEHEKGNYIIGFADPAVWNEGSGTGASVADIFAKYGVYFEKGNNSRIAGKMQLHYRFNFDAEGYPGIYIFDTCKNFIRTIPALVYDDVNTEDIDTDGEDHIYDETRYFLMANPTKSESVARKKTGIPELEIEWE